MTEITQTPSPLAEVERYRHGRVPRDVRERQVLELASELFAERGFAGASMDELARRAGVTKPVIYGLFASKEELFVATIDEFGRELTEIVTAAAAGADGPAELLRSGALAFFDFVREHDRAWRASFDALGALGSASEGVLAKVAEIRERQNAVVGAVVLATARERGVELAPERAEAFAHGLNGLFEGLANWAIDNPRTPSAELAGWVVEMIIPGLLALLERERAGG